MLQKENIKVEIGKIPNGTDDIARFLGLKPEKTIFIITLIGGGIGTIAGMYKFRHKTQKTKFTVGLPVLLVMDVLLFIWYMIL